MDAPLPESGRWPEETTAELTEKGPPTKEQGAITLTSKSKVFSIIDHGLTVEGTVTGKGQLVVKGTIKGSLEGDEVVIAEEGAVLADAKARLMTIGGRFEGNLEVTHTLTILSSGSCHGEVTCRELVVEAGGALNAKVTQLSGQPSGN